MIAEHFGKIEDPREPWKIKHDMLEIITIVILATLAGCDAWEEIEDFCKVKENQPNLYEDVRMYYEDVLSHPRHHKDEVEKGITTDKGHGRIEKRTYYLISNVDWIENRSSWSNLNGIGMVKSRVDTNGIITEDTRYYITSLTNAALFAKAARAHWGIENSLHWCLDVVFNEDHIRMRKDHTAENMAVVRHIVLNVLKSFPTEKK